VGTLVLAGVEYLPRDCQAILAEEGSGERGDLRFIGLSELGSGEAINRELVREDLGMRLSVIVVALPALRDRKEEIPIFAQHFLERANRGGGRSLRGFDQAALDAVVSYDWPGNLTELQRAVGEAAARATAAVIGVDVLPPDIRGERGAAYQSGPAAAARSLDESLEEVERGLIERALRKARHNKARAARLLGISRPRLHRRIKELGIEGGEGS
jgi:DNA-binding NtrC family response regulator